MNNNFSSYPGVYYSDKDRASHTINVDAGSKEIYCNAAPIQQINGTENENKTNSKVFWTYMMNVSMQNAVVQLKKRTVKK